MRYRNPSLVMAGCLLVYLYILLLPLHGPAFLFLCQFCDGSTGSVSISRIITLFKSYRACLLFRLHYEVKLKNSVEIILGTVNSI